MNAYNRTKVEHQLVFLGRGEEMAIVGRLYEYSVECQHPEKPEPVQEVDEPLSRY